MTKIDIFCIIKKKELTNIKHIINQEPQIERPFALGMCYDKLFWLFFIGNIVGCIVETIWCIATTQTFQMRVGLVIGPFIPIYGVGAVLITVSLYKIMHKNDILIFICSGLIGGIFEYLCSWLQEIIFHTVSWDYSDTPFNFNGRTNLMFILCWGFLGLIWIRLIYPHISQMIERIPRAVGKTLTGILTAFFIFDILLSVTAQIRKNIRNEFHQPPKTVIGEFMDIVFPDEVLNFLFPNMTPTDK